VRGQFVGFGLWLRLRFRLRLGFWLRLRIRLGFWLRLRIRLRLRVWRLRVRLGLWRLRLWRLRVWRLGRRWVVHLLRLGLLIMPHPARIVRRD
jgi:hypothetical protein